MAGECHLPGGRVPGELTSGAMRQIRRSLSWNVPVLAVLAMCVPLPASAQVQPAATCAHPADVLKLDNWKETLPTGSQGSPTEIEQPKLATYSDSPWFIANKACDGVRFRAAVNGVTTSGSGYPRSELREMKGSDEASWSTTSGTSTMVVNTAVTHEPKEKPEVVVAQIHDDSDDVTTFRVSGNKVYVTKGDDSSYKLVTSDYKLGTKFEAKFVASGGKIKAYFNGTLETTLSMDSSGDYFKTGAYVQANCDKSSPCSADNYGEAVISGLTLTHTS